MIIWMWKDVKLVIFVEIDHIQQEMDIKNNVAAKLSTLKSILESISYLKLRLN